MIALSHLEKQSLMEVFPEHCLKATPNQKFLSNLYGFDMSLCPHQTSLCTRYITTIFLENFDAVNSASRVPELLVWTQSQVCLIIIGLFILIDLHCTFIETP